MTVTPLLLAALVASADAFAPALSGAAFMPTKAANLPLSRQHVGSRLPAAVWARARGVGAVRMGEKAITPDFRLALGAIGLGTVFNQDLHFGALGWPLVILGSFLAYQTAQVRFRFTDEDIEVVRVSGLEDDGLKASVDSSGENQLQGGGANKWSFKSVVNWEFWWPGFPILVYFKETQTKNEGQIHFFPIIMDGKELYEEMHAKMGKSVNEKPAPEQWGGLRPLTPTGFSKVSKKIKGDE